MRKIFYQALSGLPSKIISGALGLGGIAAAAWPVQFRLWVDANMTPEQLRIYGVTGLIVLVVYWVVMFWLEPKAERPHFTTNNSSITLGRNLQLISGDSRGATTSFGAPMSTVMPEHVPSRVDILKAKIARLDADIPRLNPELIPDVAARYREELEKAKLNRESRLAHHIDTTLNAARQQLGFALKQASGASLSGGEGILEAPEFKNPNCPPYIDENAFVVSGNELYVWAHGENIEAATRFCENVRSKQAELRAERTKAQQELLHEYKKIEDAGNS